MIDIEKLEALPKRESRKEYLMRKYGRLWYVKRFDQPWVRSDKSDYAMVKAIRVIKKFIGKQYDKAFSEYCKLVEQYDYYIFYEEYFMPISRWGDTIVPEFIVDKQGRIQKNKNYVPYRRSKPNSFIFTSFDYEEGYMDRISKEILTGEEFRAKFRYSWEYISRHYEGKYVKVVINGFWKEFESEKDPDYIRLCKEKLKQTKLNEKRWKKYNKEKPYNFLTDEEKKRKESEEDDRLKIERYGFDSESFKGEGYHGKKRKQ
jgi:hypothetical protein